VPDVTVWLREAQARETRTSLSGEYTFTAVADGACEIEPERIDKNSRAVSALDAAYVLQAVNGRRVLDDFQAQLCDVTGDGRLDERDAAAILSASVGAGGRFPASVMCDSDWLFMPAGPDGANRATTLPRLAGTCRRGKIAWTPLDAPATGQDFLAGLVGDCSGNWPTAAGSGLGPGYGAASAHLGRLRRVRAMHARLPLYVRPDRPFYSVEAEIAYDPSRLQARSIRARRTAHDAMVSMNDTEPGHLRVALASAQPIMRESTPVLVVDFAINGRASSSGPPVITTLRVDERSAEPPAATTASAR